MNGTGLFLESVNIPSSSRFFVLLVFDLQPMEAHRPTLASSAAENTERAVKSCADCFPLLGLQHMQ